jgi:hypothetical protein
LVRLVTKKAEIMKKVLVFLCVLIASLAVAVPQPSTIPAPSKHSRLAGREGGGAGREGGGLRDAGSAEGF